MSSRIVNHEIQQQAKAWIRCLHRGLNNDEKPQLVAWMNQHPEHHRAIYQSATILDNISELNELNGIFPVESKAGFIKKYTKQFFAIFIALFTILAYYLVLLPQVKHLPIEQSKTYVTKVGEVNTVKLSDGSEVTLNTNTKLVVNFSQDHRSISLLYGEAQFNVTKNQDRPFTVTSGMKSFTALGTVFNVQKDNESDMELLVTEGRVLISDAHLSEIALSQMISEEAEKIGSNAIINIGEKSKIVDMVARQTITMTVDELDEELAWQQGMIVFNGETLNEALREVSRYTDVQFEIVNDHVGELLVAGYFKAGDVENLLASLSYNFGVEYEFRATNSVQIGTSNNN